MPQPEVHPEPTAVDGRGCALSSGGVTFDLQALAHDLRHSVATLAKLAELVDAAELPAPTAGWWRAMRVEIAAMRELCERALADVVPPSGCELSAVVAEVLGTLCSPRCTLRRSGTPVCAAVGRVAARRVVVNLLRNAVAAAGPLGTVQVHTSLVAGWAQLVVEDDGPGFDDVPWGIGLRVVAREVARAGGTLDIGRSQLGGAAVRVQLPFAA